MAQTSQEPGPTDTSTAEKCRSRQTGSASYKVNMLKYHCCWMQHCKWVCMLKFEQVHKSDWVVLHRDSESLRWPWATSTHTGHYQGSTSGLQGLMCHTVPWAFITDTTACYTESHTYRILISNSLYTESTNWECTGFPTFTKCHFTSIQQQTWMKWPQVLLSSSQFLELECPALSFASTAVYAL